jgi:glycosyltransferase involved in cell wall biosynthesis
MKLSVCMITYNHANFIHKAIEGVMLQKTGFDYELFIGEDCSTDNTRQICLKYQQSYPDRIRLLLNETNKGIAANFIYTLSQCTGEYIAICEGDDYWTDPYKLQKQVDFLDNNPDCSFCYTNSYSFYDGNENEKRISITEKPPEKYDLEYFLTYSPNITHLTKVYRKSMNPENLPDWICKVIKLDYVFNILHLEKGKAGYVDDITSCYRIHSGGVISYTNRIKNLENILYPILNLEKHFYPEYQDLFLRIKRYHYDELALEYLRKGSIIKYLQYISLAFRIKKYRTFNYYFSMIKRSVKIVIGRN